MTLAQNFAKNFTRARTRKGWSQEQLAAESHLSVSYISMLQCGVRTPPLNTVEQIASALGVRPLDLLKAA